MKLLTKWSIISNMHEQYNFERLASCFGAIGISAQEAVDVLQNLSNILNNLLRPDTDKKTENQNKKAI